MQPTSATERHEILDVLRGFALYGVLLALCRCASPVRAPATAAPERDEIDRYVDGEMQQRGIPGAAVGVVRAGKIVKLAAYGWSSHRSLP